MGMGMGIGMGIFLNPEMDGNTVALFGPGEAGCFRQVAMLCTYTVTNLDTCHCKLRTHWCKLHIYCTYCAYKL